SSRSSGSRCWCHRPARSTGGETQPRCCSGPRHRRRCAPEQQRAARRRRHRTPRPIRCDEGVGPRRATATGTPAFQLPPAPGSSSARARRDRRRGRTPRRLAAACPPPAPGSPSCTLRERTPTRCACRSCRARRSCTRCWLTGGAPTRARRPPPGPSPGSSGWPRGPPPLAAVACLSRSTSRARPVNAAALPGSRRCPTDSAREVRGHVRASRAQRREIAAGHPVATQQIFEERERGLLADLLLAVAADVRLVSHAILARAAVEAHVVRGASERDEEPGDLRLQGPPIGKESAYDPVA